MRDVDSLIADAFAGNHLAKGDIQRIERRMLGAGFDKDHTVAVGNRLAGMKWQGRRLDKNTRLPTAVVHYLRHVVSGEEWPNGTTIDEYVASASAIAGNPDAGVFVSVLDGEQTIGIIGPTGPAQGPRGFPWTLVEYKVSTGHWATVFQLARGLDYVEKPLNKREGFRWLRKPRS